MSAPLSLPSHRGGGIIPSAAPSPGKRPSRDRGRDPLWGWERPGLRGRTFRAGSRALPSAASVAASPLLARHTPVAAARALLEPSSPRLRRDPVASRPCSSDRGPASRLAAGLSLASPPSGWGGIRKAAAREYKGGWQSASGRTRENGRPERAAMPLHCLLLLLPWLGTASVAAQIPACKMRITDKGLALVKQEGLRFVEQELESISIPDLHGKQGRFHYNISNVKVTHLQLNFSELHFQPEQHLAFRINNGSIGVRFRRQLLYWFFYDIGSIKTWAEGVNIHTLLRLSRDQGGRLKIANMSCHASIARMHAGFSGTLRKVYEFVAKLITTGMRYLISQQICPALNHAGLVLLNSLLDTVPVRNPVDEYVGSDYSLLNDPHVTPENIDLDFKGMFFPLQNENETLPNLAPEPLLRETERMVYMGLSEYFFDSALFSYYQAEVLNMEFAGDEVPKDLQVLLRASFFGSIMLLNPEVVDAPLTLKLQVTEAPRCTIRPSGTSVSVSALLNIFLAPLNQPPILLSSLTMESRLSAKVVLHHKALRVQLDLRRFRIYSSQSAFESLALLPLQAPLKTLLQMTIMPFINEKTMKGVQIPLPEGMDFTKEAVRSHLGYLTIGADLHFTKGLREVIEKLRATPSPSLASRAA